MKDNNLDRINEIDFTKRCILMSVISQEKNLTLINSFHKIPIVKLYIADSSFDNFIYSKIKGAFCLFMSKEKDPKNRKYFFHIYDIKDYSLCFNMEIKKEYMQYITQYKEDFYFMELRQSFLGFKFLSKESGRQFFLLLNEDPKKEIIEQNEGAKNIKSKEVSKTANKVIDYLKMRLKYKFQNSGTGAITTNYRKRELVTQKKESFPIMNIDDVKAEYLDTSIIPYIELLINNLEIDDDSNVLLFTEKKLNYEKCKSILKKYENNLENSLRRRNNSNIPITIIDKDCMNISNKDLYINIMVKNMLNNIRMQKRLDVFRQEHKKRHKGIPTGMGNRRRTKGRLTKGKKDRPSILSKMSAERASLSEISSEDKNRRNTSYNKESLKFKANNLSNIKGINNISTNIKLNSKSVDKENTGRFAKDKRKINAMQKTDMLKGLDDDEEDGDLDKGGFNYFYNDKQTTNNNKQNNINIKKGVDIIEERPEDEEKDRERKYKKRELKLPNKYTTNITTNKSNNIKTNIAQNNNIRTNISQNNNIRTNIAQNNIKTNIAPNNNMNSISSRANVYKRTIIGRPGMNNFIMGKEKNKK